MTDSDNARRWSRVTVVATALLLGLLAMLIGIVCGHSGVIMSSGVLLMLSLGGALFVKKLAGYRFTNWILIANIAAMLKPDWFLSVGNLSLSDPWLLLIVVQLIMFGMGTQMSFRDFAHVLRMPGAVVVGIVCQLMIMPLLGFSLAKLFQFPPEIGAGLVLIGSCSSGLASNVMTYLAKGNLALSVTLTAIATAIAPAITPLWMKLLAGTMVDVNMLQMSLTIVKIVLVPILAAFVHEFLCSNKRNVRMAVWCSSLAGVAWLVFLMSGGWTKMTSNLDIEQQANVISLLALPGFVAGALVFGTVYHGATKMTPSVVRWMPAVSMLGIVYFTLVSTAKGRDQLLDIGLLLVLAVTLHNLLGYVLGFWASRLLSRTQTDARTIAIEVGSQNGAMALGLADSMGKLHSVGLAAVIFAVLMNVTGSIIANYWRRTATVSKPLEAN